LRPADALCIVRQLPVRSIAILFHADQRDPASVPYRIWSIAHTWRALGIRVETLRGASAATQDAALACDLLVPHVDCSIRPPAYQALIERHPLAMNCRVADITKRAVSTQLLTRDDAARGVWPGPVIIKTNRNCGGLPDYLHVDRAAERLRSLLARARRRVTNHPRLSPLLYPYGRTLLHYPVLPSALAVPRAVWRNPHLVVERFVPERHAGQYVLHLWIFMGKGGFRRTIICPVPQVKARLGTTTYHEDAPPQVALAAARIGIDFGKLDYVCPEGGDPIILDVNTTPTFPGDVHGQESIALCRPLALAALEWAGE
jgi:hypothetical protein